MSDSSSSCESISSDSLFELLPDQTILDKFEDYKVDLDQFLEDEKDKSVVNIDFSTKFMITFGLFQEALKRNELSDRTLSLTKACIFLNPANYTVWYFRRVILFELNKNLYDEINFINDIIADNQKNYQIWQHRKCIVKRLKDASKEKEFTKHVLLNDSKNYHAWQYRQWFINKFNLLNGEIEYTNNLLTVDVRNNSAWNHRFYVLDKLGKLKDKENDDFKQEIQFVIDKIKIAPNNESSWNYLIGLLGNENLNSNETVNKFIQELESTDILSPFYYSFKLDQLMLKLEKNSNKELAEKAIELANSLASVHDKIREKYWNYIKLNIQKKIFKQLKYVSKSSLFKLVQ